MWKRAGARVRVAVMALIAGLLLPANAECQLQTQGQTETPTATETETPTAPQAENQTAVPDEVQSEAQGEEDESLEAPRPSTAAEILDALIVRPLTFVVLPIGIAAFIPAALITAPNGMDSVQEALELFVTAPAKYVFQRPLGEI